MRSERQQADENLGPRRRSGAAGVAGNKLAVNLSKLDFSRFAYRWINDVPARIHAKTVDDDWDLVPNDGVKEDSAGMGNYVRQIVGVQKDGSTLFAYLCRKPKTYFDDDQKDKHKALDQQLEQLRRGNAPDGSQQSDYVPSSGISI